MNPAVRLLITLMIPALGRGVCAGGALTPDEAVKSFDFEPGLRVELVASEPFTASPCALAWDERGRLFVTENRGYPLGGPGGRAVGVVAVLVDTNGDGRIDRRTEFATDLTYPNGLLPWRGGLIVTCAPDVFYFKDSDGDGKADVKEILLTGFATNQSTQLRVNAPVLGPDGWVYLASGLSRGRITSPKRPQQAPLELKGDLRFNPDTGEYQPADGKSQFGQSFDDFGRRFGVFNRVQVQHFVLPSRYLDRNPRLNFGAVIQNCPDLLPNALMRGGGAAARIYPISANITTADSHAGTFSAACAIHIYRGGALPSDYRGHAFSCDPTGNLVHHDRLEPNGATFSARRVREKAEFLRSRDDWFRPCFLATGPDGALYVADMYRKVIEHPEYLPEEVRKRTDFESGKGLGRIWRVTSSDFQFPAFTSRLPIGDPLRLSRELDSPNAWRRDTAFRLLLEQNDKSIVRELKKGIGKSATPPGVAARLHLLELLDGLDEGVLATALRSPEPGVREVALSLAEPRLEQSPKLHARVLKLASDEDSRVRFQAVLSLGPANGSDAIAALTRVALRGADDRWTRAAVLSSVPECDGQQQPLLSGLLKAKPAESDGITALLLDLSRMIALATPEGSRAAVLRSLLKQSAANGFAIQAGIAEGFAEGTGPAKDGQAGPVLLSLAPVPTAALFETARNIALSSSEPLPRRNIAVRMLGLALPEFASGALLALLRTNDIPEIQMASIRAVAELDGPKAVEAFLTAGLWPRFSPALREATLASLLSHPRHYSALLDAIDSGAISLSALDSNRRERLKKANDPTVRDRAEKLFAAAKSGERMKAFEQARAALDLKPMPANGQEVFKRACANCHRLEGDGFAVGPDLFDIRNQPKESILLHIVVPEYEIAPNFVSYICEKKDGSVVSGLLASESPSGLTLRQALGVEEQIARADIASLTASPLSLMPQELEKGMTLQELADLLAFLRGER